MGRAAKAQSNQQEKPPAGGWTPENIVERITRFQRRTMRNYIFGQPPLIALRQTIDAMEEIEEEIESCSQLLERCKDTPELRAAYQAAYRRSLADSLTLWKRDLCDVSRCMLGREHQAAFEELVMTRLK